MQPSAPLRLRSTTRFAAVRIVWVAFLAASCLSQTSQAPSPSQKAADRELEESFNEIRKDPRSWAQSLLEAQESLAKFGYGTLFTAKLDDRTKEALRAYQEKNHLTATGDFDFATWMRILDDERSLTADVRIGPAYLFNDKDWENVVTVQGVWLEQGKEPTSATPLRMTRIECFKSNRLCVTATSGDTLINLGYLEVERWDKFEIETQPDDLPCGREYIQISRPQKSVLTINTAVYKNEEACTKLFGPPGKPMVSRLADSEPLTHLKLKAFREASDRILVIPPDAKERAGSQNH